MPLTARRLSSSASRRARWVAVAVGCALPAAAAESLQGTGELSVGWTDNVQSAPDDPLPGVPERESDGFMIVSPGAVLALTYPSARHHFGFTHAATLFFGHPEADNSSNRLDYQSFLDLSPRIALLVDANLTQAAPHTQATVTAPTTTELGAVLPRTDAYVTGAASWTLSFDLAPEYRTWQTSRVGFGVPLSRSKSARTIEMGASLGGERTFRSDALGSEVTVDHATVTRVVSAAGTREDTARQVTVTGVGRWRHDIGRDFASRLEAGALRIQRLNTDRGAWHPTGTAALGYAVEQGSAELRYAHRVTTNLVLGQYLLVDEVVLSGAVPLAQDPELVVAANVGHQWGRLIEEDAALAAHVRVLMADVGLGWKMSDLALLGLRYQHLEQHSDARSIGLPLSFVKNSVLLSVALRFPPDSAMPRAYRPPIRVDRSDELGSSRTKDGPRGRENGMDPSRGP
jgi:hypothetical protein